MVRDDHMEVIVRYHQRDMITGQFAVQAQA